MRLALRTIVAIGILTLTATSAGCALKRVPMAVIQPAYSYVRDPLVKLSPFDDGPATRIAKVKSD